MLVVIIFREWICDYVTPDGMRKRKSLRKKKFAGAYKVKVQIDVDEGVYIDPERYRNIPLGQLIVIY
jgi:hypothetical protein